jgi:hypothetical protein
VVWLQEAPGAPKGGLNPAGPGGIIESGE